MESPILTPVQKNDSLILFERSEDDTQIVTDL